MLLVYVEPDVVEQSVDYLRGGAQDLFNFDFSNALDVFVVAVILDKAYVILRPTFMNFFSINSDYAKLDVLWTRWLGFCLIRQRQEIYAIYGQQENFLMLVEAKLELPRRFAALELQGERAWVCQLLVLH